MSISILDDLTQASARHILNNQTFGSAGLLRGTTNAASLRIVNALHYRFGGQAFLRAAEDNIALTAQPTQAANTTAFYLVLIDGAGALSVLKGADGSTVLPAVPVNRLLIGVLRVALAGGATFTSGTTALNAANVTATIANANFLPHRADALVLTYAAT